MRLPWWPIYSDAHLKERGVSFSHPRFSIDFVPWHLVGVRGQNLVCFEANGTLIRSKKARLHLRVDRASMKEAISLQKRFINNPASSYTCSIKLDVYKRSVLAGLVLLFAYTTLFPMIFIALMIQGYRTAPLNDPGERYQHAIIFGGTLLVLAVVFIHWRVWRSYRSYRRAKKVISLDQNGLTATGGDTTQAHYTWNDIHRFKPGFLWYLITMRSGEQLVIPQKAHAWTIVQQRSRVAPTPIRSSILYASLILAICSGPLMWGWFKYLLPEDPLPPHTPWAVSAVAIFQVLFFASIVRFSAYFEKRKLAKSEEQTGGLTP
ncbi:MAG: hypothetical protein JJ916_00235 [Phycisphaerales bacterium]|nr:hypothetical protein [Phycisphaerales bacterium]